VDKPLKSVTHGQCNARPTVTFPVAGHRWPATGAKLYCLVTEAHVCEQLAQGRYVTAGWRKRSMFLSVTLLNDRIVLTTSPSRRFEHGNDLDIVV